MRRGNTRSSKAEEEGGKRGGTRERRLYPNEAQDNLTNVTTTMNATTKRQVVLPKAMCERKKIQPGTSLRISEVGNGFYVTPVPEPAVKELAAVCKPLDGGRRTRTITDEDEARIQQEIEQYRAEQPTAPCSTF